MEKLKGSPLCLNYSVVLIPSGVGRSARKHFYPDERFLRSQCNFIYIFNFSSTESIISPMCQRNLPASFWNSNYQHNKYTHHHPHHSSPSNCQGSTSNSTQALFTDPYPPPLHRSVHQPDPWHYPFVSQSSYSHRSSIHDLTYGMSMTSGASAFNPRYSSLLIQPPVRSGRLPTMPGQCDFTKGNEGWPSSYSHGHSQQLSSEIAPYGMESGELFCSSC